MRWQLAKAVFNLFMTYDIPAELIFQGNDGLHLMKPILKISVPKLGMALGEFDASKRLPNKGDLSQADLARVKLIAETQKLGWEEHEFNILIY